MRYYIEQQVNFPGGIERVCVRNEKQGRVLSAEHGVLSPSVMYHVYQGFGGDLALIKRKLFSFFPVYRICFGEYEAARVIMKPSFFCRSYTVKGPGWEIEGDIFGNEYEITSQGKTVACLSKQHVYMHGYEYSMTILKKSDTVLTLCVALAILSAHTPVITKR